MLKTTTAIAAAFVTVWVLAPRPAGANGEPPRIDDAHPPLALWYGGVPPGQIRGQYPPFLVDRNVAGYGFYRRPLRHYRYRYRY
jgi:hypothetical protein